MVTQLVHGGGACGAKPSHRGSVLASEVQAGFWVESTLMGWGTSGLRWQGDVIQQHVKGAWLGPKTKNQAAGIQFWLENTD